MQLFLTFAMQYKNSGSGHSTMDVERVNMYKFPEVANTPWHHATLTSGDCILIPAGAQTICLRIIGGQNKNWPRSIKIQNLIHKSKL